MNYLKHKFLLEQKITEAEAEILFEDKNNWYSIDGSGKQDWNNSKDKISAFKQALKKFLSLQSDNDEEYYLEYIIFPTFNIKDYFKNQIDKNINFSNAIFLDEVRFFDITFNKDAVFYKASFYQDVSFAQCIFSEKANFFNTTFYKKVYFYQSKFTQITSFFDASFKDEVTFNGSIFDELLLFNNVSLYKIDLENIQFGNANFLNLKGYSNKNEVLEEVLLNSKHFANKESARLIKAHLEKQNNITEANKYFVIEQEKYIEELENNKNRIDDNKVRKLIPLYFNKIVSHFGTDWVRAILILLLWGIMADNVFLIKKGNNLILDWKYFGFSIIVLLSYIVTYIHDTKGKILKELFLGLLLFVYIIFAFNNNLNHIVKLLNPINAFKDDDIFKGHEAFGALVRIISATIIYQIIVAFRQFTRRS